MIYGIAEVDDLSTVKIGYTSTPNGRVSYKAARTRLSGLQVSTWRELVCIATAPGTLTEERRLHEAFEALHVRGEWFKNTGPVTEWLQSWSIPLIRCGRAKNERAAISRPAAFMYRRLPTVPVPSTTPPMESVFVWRGKSRGSTPGG